MGHQSILSRNVPGIGGSVNTCVGKSDNPTVGVDPADATGVGAGVVLGGSDYGGFSGRATSRIGGGATSQVGVGEMVCYSFHYESEREKCLSVLVLNACKCRR